MRAADRTSASVATTALVLSLLAGCAAQQSRPLYQWEGYQAQVYQHLRSATSDPQLEIAALEQDLQKIRSKNGAPPPGYQAHLGLLYFAAGSDDKAVAALQAERNAFPEFEPYMNFLLARVNKK